MTGPQPPDRPGLSRRHPRPRARPRTLVFVSGTGTDVGKTWWTAALARELRARGVVARARKPVQSGDADREAGGATDADVLAAATAEDPTTVCPPARHYPLAWAPPMAAAELGRPPFTVADLAAEITWPRDTHVGLVEGVGGPRSPIAADGDSVTLAELLAPDLVVLVADAGLGTINAVRLSVAAFADDPSVAAPVIVALNRYTDDRLQQRNRYHLATVDGFDVVTTPAELAARL
jgi:dethiobiotin synthase